MAHDVTLEENCTHLRSYSTRWDAYYCEVCDKWLEGKCRDPDCEFCKKRPEKPSDMEKK